MNAKEWKKQFQAGKAARTDGVLLWKSASSAWQVGWKQQDELMRLRTVHHSVKPPAPTRRVVYAPQIRHEPKPLVVDEHLLKRRMMGGGRFVR